MKSKFVYALPLSATLFLPKIVLADSYNSSKINFLAVLNDVLDPNKLKYIILGMLVIIILLIGSILFGKNKWKLNIKFVKWYII